MLLNPLSIIGNTLDLHTQNIHCVRFSVQYAMNDWHTYRLQNEDRALERNFRKDLQEGSSVPVDQDSLKILLGLYKVQIYFIQRFARVALFTRL